LSRNGCENEDDVAVTFGKDGSSTPTIKYLKVGNQVDFE